MEKGKFWKQKTPKQEPAFFRDKNDDTLQSFEDTNQPNKSKPKDDEKSALEGKRMEANQTATFLAGRLNKGKIKAS